MLQKTKLRNIFEIIESLQEDLEFDEFFFPVDDGYIVGDDYRIIIPELDISTREGVFGYMENDEFSPDFALILLYEKDERNPENWLYYENSPLTVSVHNFLRCCGVSHRDLDEYDCIIEY